jgi:probable O-glycosylation ligase (exosortase A-associated)
MQALFILMVWGSLLALGCLAPFVASLAYIWVDIFQPQSVAPVIAAMMPISMITALAAIAAYLFADRRNPPRLGLLTVLLVAWCAWMTLTVTWAVFPEFAWNKWNWAFKTAAFTTLLPFVFTSRIRIEAALLVFVCAIMTTVLPFAVKMAISGGGYGQKLGLVSVNAGWGGEGSTLSTYAFATLPLVTFLAHHSLIAPGRRWMRYVYYLAPVLATLATMATFARAGIIAGAVWAAIAWWHSRRKVALIFALLAAIVAIQPLTSAEWTERMSTTVDARHEDSALGRLLSWQWTWDFAMRNPLGGGFDVYRASHAVTQRPDGSEFSINGLASHSIYFEVLGEQGWIGLGIFLSIVAVFFLGMMKVRRRARGREDFAWMGGLASALMQSTLIFMAGAAFSGIAHQPLQYYLIMFAVSLSAVMARVGARSAEPVAPPQAAAAPNVPSWRTRAGRPTLRPLRGPTG